MSPQGETGPLTATGPVPGSTNTRSVNRVQPLLGKPIRRISTPQVVTVVLSMANGQALHIHRDTVPKEPHLDITRKLNVPEKIMRPMKTLHGVVKKRGVRNL